MSYTVLARKFRSRNFDEVVGQPAIVTTLRNAIQQNRIHHGYLFTGTRGVGKTSMARILAKCLNCLKADGPTIDPCGECDSCVSIARGEDMDVVEIDAASNTGVDNIRELRNNAVFRPARSRFKVYIIDEVHMLSTGAFNALLKTLEEPPDHVKFILATTEVQKVPPTILSRVQRFDFRSISPGDIAAQLKMICEAESVPAEDEAIRRLARLAAGSMRDALSLLDQAVSMSAGKLTAAVIDELFPATHDEEFSKLIDRLADSDAAGALAIADRTLNQGHTPDYWCSRLIAQLRDLMVLRVCGENTDMVDVPAALRTALTTQAQRFDAGAFVYMISILEELRRSVRSSGSGRALIEAAVIRLADASKFSSIESLLQMVSGGAGVSPSSAISPSVAPPAKPAPAAPAPRAVAPTPTPEAAPKPRPPAATVPQNAPARRTTQADLKAAHAEPAVKATLDVFGGRIVDVQRGSPGSEKPAQE
jgi:DNA polymerase III subunit gamma/tau